MANQARTINLLRKSFFPRALTERIIRCVFRFATVTGILLAGNALEWGGNAIGFLVGWTGLLALEASQSRALSTGTLTSFWPGNRTHRLLAGMTAVELPALVLLAAIVFIARPSPLQVAVAVALLLAQNVILVVIEARKADGKASFEQFVRDGGVTCIIPVVLAAIAVPVRDAAPMENIVQSAGLVAVIGSEISFARRLSGFTPGVFVPDYLRTEVRRFGGRQARFVFIGVLVAGVLAGFAPVIAVGIAVSLFIGAHLLHSIFFFAGSVLGRVGLIMLFTVATSVLCGTALVLDEHVQFTFPIFLGCAAIVALSAFAAHSRLDDERIARNM